VWQKAGAGDIPPRFVNLNTVGLLNVVCNRSKIIAVCCSFGINGDYPFQSIAGRTNEKHLRIKVFVLQKLVAKQINTLQVVKINTQQARMAYECFIVPSLKHS
jgi:hypothetical protein